MDLVAILKNFTKFFGCEKFSSHCWINSIIQIICHLFCNLKLYQSMEFLVLGSLKLNSLRDESFFFLRTFQISLKNSPIVQHLPRNYHQGSISLLMMLSPNPTRFSHLLLVLLAFAMLLSLVSNLKRSYL